MSNHDPVPQPNQSPTDYESWNDGFKVGVEAGFRKAKELYNAKLMFRTFAAVWLGIFMVGFAASALGTNLWALLVGCTLTTFTFYVADQTELAVKNWWDNYRKKKEKRNGNSSSDSDHKQ